jgi:hypothetical protein
MIGQVFELPVGAALSSGEVVADESLVVALAAVAAAVSAASEGGSRSPGGVMSDAADGCKVVDVVSEVGSAGTVNVGAEAGASAAVSCPIAAAVGSATSRTSASDCNHARWRSRPWTAPD